MKQVYVPYWEWEDWLNGMWRKLAPNEESKYLKEAIGFTRDHSLYGSAMRKVAIAWPQTMLNSLTNTSINRRAFLGQCACCFAFKCPEYITRIAWHELTDMQRILADNEAQKTIDSYLLNYEAKNTRIYPDMEKTLLPGGLAR